MLGAALRFGFGTASVLAGGWVLRALQGTPAALGATPAEIYPVAKRSANYRDGAFVPYEPTTDHLPRAASSVDWYRGWRDHLEFARIEA